MKKLLILAVAVVAMTGCGYKSVVTPIEGTNLSTYTAKVDNKILLGVMNSNGNILIEAAYAAVQFRNNVLLAVSGKQATLYSVDGKKLTAPLENLYIYDGFFGVKTDGNLTTYISPEGAIVGPYDTIYIDVKDILMVKKGNSYGLFSRDGKYLAECTYPDLLCVMSETGEYFFLCSNPNSSKWIQLNDKGIAVATPTKWTVSQIKSAARKLGGKSFGSETFGGITIPDKTFKTYKK